LPESVGGDNVFPFKAFCSFVVLPWDIPVILDDLFALEGASTIERCVVVTVNVSE
jgi:hypothetical protein